MVDKNVLVAKITTIEKCLKKVREKCPPTFEQFETDEDCQDIVLFNLMQAIQGCVDLAAHIVSDEAYGMAGNMNEFFYLLQEKKVITVALQENMIKAVGFRNLVVHEYARLDLKHVYRIASNGINDLEEFIGTIVRRFA